MHIFNLYRNKWLKPLAILKYKALQRLVSRLIQNRAHFWIGASRTAYLCPFLVFPVKTGIQSLLLYLHPYLCAYFIVSVIKGNKKNTNTRLSPYCVTFGSAVMTNWIPAYSGMTSQGLSTYWRRWLPMTPWWTKNIFIFFLCRPERVEGISIELTNIHD